MQVEFIKDSKYDAGITWSMLFYCAPNERETRAKSMGIEVEVANTLAGEADYSMVQHYAEKYVSKRYQPLEQEFKQALKGYAQTWSEIDTVFSKRVPEITSHNWFHDKFFVVLSPFNTGVSSFGEDKVLRGLFVPTGEHTRITAHEILISHIWSILYERFGEEAEKDENFYYWGLNEITSNAILGLDTTLNELWPRHLRGYDSYLYNYPHLQKAKDLLKDLFINRETFNEYLSNGIKWFKESSKDS